MHKTETSLPGVVLLTPRVFEDDRGHFFESYNETTFCDLIGQKTSFVQDNQSFSKMGVLRGMHYQVQMPQGKLVRVLRGKIFDVVVDVRKKSETFGRWVGVELSYENKNQLWIPPGFAHGFLTLSDEADVLYKTTEFYAPQHERSVRWDSFGADWPFDGTPSLSKKDSEAPFLSELPE